MPKGVYDTGVFHTACVVKRVHHVSYIMQQDPGAMEYVLWSKKRLPQEMHYGRRTEYHGECITVQEL